MALGFDMADHIVDPNGSVNRRIDEWKRFFLRWNHKPEYAGRYFIERYDEDGEVNYSRVNWRDGEIPKNLRSLVPNFSELKYILPFGPSGVEVKELEVDWDGNLTQAANPNSNYRPFYYKQSGYQQVLKNQNIYAKIPIDNSIIIRNWAIEDAWSTCHQIELRLEGALNIGDNGAQFRLSDSRQVFVFLSVEPWTRIHPDYWLMWSSAIEVYPITMSLDGKLVTIQPFKPCLYYNVPTPQYNKLDIFKPYNSFRDKYFEDNIGRCHSLMSTPYGSNLAQNGTTKSTLFEMNEQDLDDPDFIPLEYSEDKDIKSEVLLWQYFIADGIDDIDLSVTTDNKYNNKPVTDYMLEIIW